MTDKNSNERIILAHGGGGELTQRLLRERIVPKLTNDLLSPLNDGALLDRPGNRICMTTDAYVVQPIEFPGGDIGRLAVCGTVNDLAVMGARPLALSLALILEEGLPIAVLDRVMDSIAAAAAEAGVSIATGDTKVIERRKGDGIMITTAGVGEVRENANLDAARIEPGDVILINGNIADHGLAVMSAREHLVFETELRTDAAPLNGLIEAILDTGADVKFMRDPTRGGVAGVITDLVDTTGLTTEIDETTVPISRTALHTAEMLGLDPLSVANEGKIVIVVSPNDAERVLAACRSHKYGKNATAIGQFATAAPALAELITHAGGCRIISRPYGEELPRIC